MSEPTQHLHQALVQRCISRLTWTTLITIAVGLALAAGVVAMLGGSLNDKSDVFLAPIVGATVSAFGYLMLLYTLAIKWAKERLTGTDFADQLGKFAKMYWIIFVVLTTISQIALNTSPGTITLVRVLSLLVGFAVAAQGIFIVSQAHKKLCRVLRHQKTR